MHPWSNEVGVQCGNLSGDEFIGNSSGNTGPQSSQLTVPLWTDPGLKSGISVHDLISTLKKKRRRVKNDRTFSQSPHAMKKPLALLERLRTWLLIGCNRQGWERRLIVSYNVYRKGWGGEGYRLSVDCNECILIIGHNANRYGWVYTDCQVLHTLHVRTIDTACHLCTHHTSSLSTLASLMYTLCVTTIYAWCFLLLLLLLLLLALM